MHHETIQKFGYPESLIKELEHWVILLRPKQVTVGSLVLACKDKNARSIGQLSPSASKEFYIACQEIENILGRSLSPDKINYLALMMVDPHVHFHVIPRYENSRELNGKNFKDTSWPKPPNLQNLINLNSEDMQVLQDKLKNHS